MRRVGEWSHRPSSSTKFQRPTKNRRAANERLTIFSSVQNSGLIVLIRAILPPLLAGQQQPIFPKALTWITAAPLLDLVRAEARLPKVSKLRTY